jgi:hypothetical protein
MHELATQWGVFGAISLGSLNGVLGVVPASAILNTLRVNVNQAWSPTTASLAIGVTPGGAQIATIDLKVTGRTEIPVPVAQMGPFAFDTPIYATVTYTGAAPGAGQTEVWLDYLAGAG